MGGRQALPDASQFAWSAVGHPPPQPAWLLTSLPKLPSPPLPHPALADNAAIFRHMDRCSYRRVLEDDGAGRRRVAVQHEASWRLLMLHGKFTTK